MFIERVIVFLIMMVICVLYCTYEEACLERYILNHIFQQTELSDILLVHFNSML